MPLYCYSASDGETIEVEAKIQEARPETISRRGRDGKRKRFRRNVAADHGQFVATNGRGWPILSDAMGVSAGQVATARETDKKLGVPADYTPDGRIEFKNLNHQRRWLDAHGYTNFGDIR
jgi:hypothetical protein